jgi:phosphoglycolate phosphatase
MRIAVFDLDGTLADTSADLVAAANAVLAEAGFGAPLDARADAAVAFAGGRAMLREGLARTGGEDEAAVAQLYPRLLDSYRANIDAHTRLYGGAEAALDALEARGWLLAVCTNKPVALAELLLERMGLGARFRAVLGADSLEVRKPDPLHLVETVARAGGLREHAVLVGDTATDREAARRAGIPCVLVTFGPAGAGVARLEPEALLGHYDELADLLDRLMPPETVAS